MNPALWLWKCFCFLLFYIKEVILSNVRVAYDVLTPTHHMKPGFVAIPLNNLTERQILVLGNLVTMTPGTLSMDVSSDRKTLYLHAMYIDDPDAVRLEIGVYQDKIREIF